jgi:hypothetical protein
VLTKPGRTAGPVLTGPRRAGDTGNNARVRSS